MKINFQVTTEAEADTEVIAKAIMAAEPKQFKNLLLCLSKMSDSDIDAAVMDMGVQLGYDADMFVYRLYRAVFRRKIIQDGVEK